MPAEDSRQRTEPLQPVSIDYFNHFKNDHFCWTPDWIPIECGGQFVLPKGSFASPNYPNNFEKNTTCEWLLETEASHTMALQFSDMDLEESVNCSETSVKVWFFQHSTFSFLKINHLWYLFSRFIQAARNWMISCCWMCAARKSRKPLDSHRRLHLLTIKCWSCLKQSRDTRRRVSQPTFKWYHRILYFWFNN